jgi:DNA-binding winged helix-turn-helix (wHTH) protein
LEYKDLEMPTNDVKYYEFDSFRLETGERRLLHHGEVVPLAPKVFDTLAVLVESGGRLIGKEELMETVWADTFVEEANLTVNISALRKALGENSNGQSYIETVPRKGYRFTARVRAATEDERGMQ